MRPDHSGMSLHHAPQERCARGWRMSSSQGGLRAGSPPSPPPQLIRPTVRRLLRSPRFWVRVPLRDSTLSESDCRRLLFHDPDEFQCDVAMVVPQVLGDPRVLDQSRQVTLRQDEIEVVRTIRLVYEPKLSVQTR
jgi:hypothetical protein